MTLERRIARLERLLLPSPDEGPMPLCTCYPSPPTFRDEAEMEAAAQIECSQHGKRFRFCLIAPAPLTEEQWSERKQRLQRPEPQNGEEGETRGSSLD
jgi:hypothetical protein